MCYVFALYVILLMLNSSHCCLSDTEATNDPLHWIINYIFEILTRERLGYKFIEFVNPTDKNINVGLSRLMCSDPKCKNLPEVHLNLLLWLPLGVDIKFWASPDYITDYGPLGPVHQWRLFGQSSFPLFGKEHHYSSCIQSMNKIKNVLSLEYDHTAETHFLYDFYDVGGCLDQRMSNVSFKMTNSRCFDRVPLETESFVNIPCCHSNDASVAYCQTRSYHAIKISWTKLQEISPQIHELMSRMHFSPYDLAVFVKMIQNAHQVSEKEKHVIYRNTACRWLRSNPSIWQTWTKDWNKKLNLTIAGMFSLYGKWRLTGLERVAQEAVQFVNADSDYFHNSEYFLSLDVRNLTCEPDVVLSDYFKVLENADSSHLIGSIAALCSDSIEAVVELANVREKIVVSPTVATAQFLKQEHYEYFFRTVPSMTQANFILIRLFHKWGWRRIVIFRKVDHFFDPSFFQTKGIEIIADVEIGGEQFSFEIAKHVSNFVQLQLPPPTTLEQLKYIKSRIFVIEYDAHDTYLILCAAYHLGMHFDAGYVWFLNPLLSDQWWSKFVTTSSECTASQMINITSWTFVVGHQLLTGPMVHSFIPLTAEFFDANSNNELNVRDKQLPDEPSGYDDVDDAIVGDKSQLHRRRIIRSVASTTSDNVTQQQQQHHLPKKPPSSQSSSGTFGKPKNPMQDYLVYTYDAVILLASAVVHLLRENPAAVSALNQPQIARALRDLVAQTDFGYRFHRKNVDDEVANIEFPNDPFGTDAGFQLAGDYYGIRNQLPASASNLRFNKNNERVADYWLLKQRQVNITVPIIMWSTKTNQTGVLNATTTPTNVSKPDSLADVDMSKLASLALLYDQFQDRMVERWLDYVNWSSLGGPPADGSVDEDDCRYLSFLSIQMNMGCKGANVFVSVLSTLVVLIPIILFAHCYYRHKWKEMEQKTRKPYDELCAELEDLTIPAENIVVNRGVGQGAFGLVYGGEAKKYDVWEAVAVKVINDKASYERKIDFLSESKLMRSFDHRNVIRLIGISLNVQENSYLIMELMLFGDLKTYLLSRRNLAQSSPYHDDIKPETLTQMAMDIAQGVIYLHSKNLIHRDIACRNCLVGADRTVKIGDFGLTRHTSKNVPEGYYRFTRNCELPIRWMSPEAIQYGVFSVRSDIWSYGITLYEVITFGVFPYNGLGDVEVVERVKRMEFSITDFLPPNAMNTIVYNLINSCCRHHWTQRPAAMTQVLEVLHAYPTCVQPFLTDEPPKPNLTMDSLLFQPTVVTSIKPDAVLDNTEASLNANFIIPNDLQTAPVYSVAPPPNAGSCWPYPNFRSNIVMSSRPPNFDGGNESKINTYNGQCVRTSFVDEFKNSTGPSTELKEHRDDDALYMSDDSSFRWITPSGLNGDGDCSSRVKLVPIGAAKSEESVMRDRNRRTRSRITLQSRLRNKTNVRSHSHPYLFHPNDDDDIGSEHPSTSSLLIRSIFK